MSGSAEVHRRCSICSTVESENHVRVMRCQILGRLVLILTCIVLIILNYLGPEMRRFTSLEAEQHHQTYDSTSVRKTLDTSGSGHDASVGGGCTISSYCDITGN